MKRDELYLRQNNFAWIIKTLNFHCFYWHFFFCFWDQFHCSGKSWRVLPFILQEKTNYWLRNTRKLDERIWCMQVFLFDREQEYLNVLIAYSVLKILMRISKLSLNIYFHEEKKHWIRIMNKKTAVSVHKKELMFMKGQKTSPVIHNIDIH